MTFLLAFSALIKLFLKQKVESFQTKFKEDDWNLLTDLFEMRGAGRSSNSWGGSAGLHGNPGCGALAARRRAGQEQRARLKELLKQEEGRSSEVGYSLRLCDQTLIHAIIKALSKNRRSSGIHILHKLDIETTKQCIPPDWMKTQMNSSFSDELGRITDATDEEQDDLPYDEDVGITCKCNNNSDNLNDCTCTKDISGILNLACSEDNRNVKATASYETHPQPEEFSSHHRDALGTTGISVEVPGREAAFKRELPVGSFSKPDSKEHLTNSKMSNVLLRHFSKGELISTCQLIECETIPETSFTESIDDTLNKPEPSEHVKGPLAREQCTTNFEEYHLEKHKEVNAGDKNQNLLNGNRCVPKKPTASTVTCGCRQENSQLVNENEDTRIFQNVKEERTLFKETVSPHKLKHGQGQAHYCLPDFSKVSSEVEVPKRSDNINSVPTTERAKSFPVSLSQSVTVNNILKNKNYFNSAEVENREEMSIPELLQQLEMLTQHADTQNHTDHLRSNPKVNLSEQLTNNSPYVFLKLTLGEKMSRILKDQTDQLIKKALNQLKRYLDALERNYLTAREEHRNLQLQNYKDKSINIGEFDPERKVEGEIFRLGMLLEDIQEQTDDSKCNLSSLLTSYESAHSSYSLCERCLSPEERDAAEGLASHSQGTLSKKFNADEERMKGQNFEAAKTCYSSTYDKSILSHQYSPSKKSARSKSAISIRNRNASDSNANILSSTLDHAIQTANSLKKATERMVQAVSEDLAKVKRKQL
ncbi:PREDICTED: protein AKNAD1 [Pygoscelis adeliae]|uniref:protein AKNAD1 n=1 Tax=Pygoscelis adeliae TaxID=9238 RepID=UPI0004F4FE45|nr:PREDICTED: protein AKNAD1 [Pygoscelis adeliae]